MTPIQLLFNLVLLVLFGDHLWHCVGKWEQERSSRALRGVLMAVLVEVLAASAFLRTALGLLFGDATGLLIFVYVLWGMALVIGLWLFVSWRRDPPP